MEVIENKARDLLSDTFRETCWKCRSILWVGVCDLRPSWNPFDAHMLKYNCTACGGIGHIRTADCRSQAQFDALYRAAKIIKKRKRSGRTLREDLAELDKILEGL